MLFRCILKYETKKYFIGYTYNKQWYIIIKNEFNRHFKVGNDYNFFADRLKGFIIDKLVPLNEEEIYSNNKCSNES